MRCAVAVAVVIAGGAALAETTQSAFEAATALEAKGEYAAAAAALESLGHARPTDSFAADALYEAAVVAEERLADPARAQKLYAEVAAKYPSSRLSRRARTRAEFLAQSLSTGEEPLRQYDAILAAAASRPKAESIAKMSELLRAHPDFALADRATFWLAQRLSELHRDDEATARLRELEQRFPSSEWADRAKKARADILVAHGHPFVARAIYAELAQSENAITRSSGREGLADARSWMVRTVLVVLSIVYLVGFAALNLRDARRRLRRVPLELYYYVPVAALFVAAALTENPAIGWATCGIAVGGALLVWLTSLSWGARLERGPMSLGARAGRALSVLVAVCALTFLVVQATGLTDVVVETFRTGPERD
jgi:TolA-binding protein